MGNQEEQGGTEEGEFSSLGLALLKQFAAGFSATCLFITYTCRLFLLVFTRKKMFFHARNMCKHSRLAKLRSRCLRLSSCHIRVEQFWEERDLLDPKLRKAAAMEGGNDPSEFLPLALPGDGAQTWINVISMQPCLSSSSVSKSQMLLIPIPKAAVNTSEKLEEDTMRHIWKALVWGCKHIFGG